jgi:predicted RNase H-like HicB family nuclease
MMQYQVLVQSNNENAFIASIIGVPDCVAEGQTREEAIARARDALTARLAQGEVVTIEVELSEIAPARNPWLDNFGRFKDDPTFDDFLAEIEYNRRASSEDESQ